jgi:hypothetical protein
MSLPKKKGINYSLILFCTTMHYLINFFQSKSTQPYDLLINLFLGSLFFFKGVSYVNTTIKPDLAHHSIQNFNYEIDQSSF